MLNKTTEYALRAALYLAGNPGRSPSRREIAKATRIPSRYVYKVLQSLVRAGLVRSEVGRGGGYCLARKPDALTLLDIAAATAPVERIRSCPLGLKSHTSLCPLHRRLDAAYAALEDVLRQFTLGDVLRDASPIVPFSPCRQEKE
ncbi:MAG: RrF2 family transcriptional regulator [Thermoguttaceae bacterium]|jgi:Rrf2 family nitric oxide-sensitive transcriptional repressor